MAAMRSCIEKSNFSDEAKKAEAFRLRKRILKPRAAAVDCRLFRCVRKKQKITAIIVKQVPLIVHKEEYNIFRQGGQIQWLFTQSRQHLRKYSN